MSASTVQKPKNVVTLKRQKQISQVKDTTHQKELLKSCKKVQKAKNTRKRLYSKESSTVDEIQILLSDYSSDNFSDSCDVEKNLLVPNCTNEPAIGDYVIVELKTFSKKYYVSQITKNIDFEGDYEISYMRKKRSVTESFSFLRLVIWRCRALVKEKDIRAVLPTPKECGSTSRQRSSLKFDYDFFSSMYINS